MDIHKTLSEIGARTKAWKWELILSVVGIVIAILAIFVQPLITKELLSEWLTIAKAQWIGASLSVVVLCLVFVAIKQRLDMQKQRKEMQSLHEKAQQEIQSLSAKVDKQEPRKFERFERINKIVYGHIEYYPLVHYTQRDGAPRGIGIRLIEEIFGKGAISQYPKRGRWDELVNKLSLGEYDIVATPLYETRERSKVVTFCSPIFFSDIGIYVKAESKLFNWPQNSLTFHEATALLRRLKDLNLTAIDGELSGKMILKHLQVEKDKVNWLSREESSVPSLIGALGDEKMSSDVVFAEVFQAEQTEAVKNGSVINLLEPKQLLYPVSFAIRKQEYVLRHFINLKLAEIDEEHAGGILGFILEELKKHPDFEDFDLPKVRQYFVREKPEKVVPPNPANN